MSNYSMELYHHGRLGQKWGKKNGPPYPLNYDDLSAEERQKAKGEAIRRGDVKEVNANRKHFTDAEIRDVINRYKLNSELNELSKDKIKTGMDKVAEYTKKAETIGNALQKTANAVENGTKAYNHVAKLMNALGDHDLPIIGGNDNNNNNNKDNNKDNNNQKPDRTKEKRDKYEIQKKKAEAKSATVKAKQDEYNFSQRKKSDKDKKKGSK